jgi:hypothetical protein
MKKNAMEFQKKLLYWQIKLGCQQNEKMGFWKQILFS